MVGVILISENREGREILKTVHRLVGKTEGIKALMLKQGGAPTRMKSRLKKALAGLNGAHGIILLTDIYGSTQCNVCMNFLKKGSVEIFTGFNLPMVVKLASLNKTVPFKKLIPFVENYGKSHFMHVTNKRRGKKP